MGESIKRWLVRVQKKADMAFQNAEDVIKDYGREADELAHQASDKIREVMKPVDEHGAKIGGINVKPPVDRR
jgi:hypothetical protein